MPDEIKAPAQQPGGSTPQGTNPQASQAPGVGGEANAANPGATPAAKKFDAEKFASATRREQAARALEGRAKSEWEKSQAAINEAKSYQQEKLEFKKNPIAFLEKHFGMTYEQLTEIQLNGGELPDGMKVSNQLSEIEQWKKDQEDRIAKEKEEADSRAAKAQEELTLKQIDEFKKSIPDKIKSIEKLDMVNLLEPEQLSEEIFKIIETHWASEEEKVEKDANYQPALLSVDEAADILEEVLSEQFMAKAGRTKKFGELIRNASKPANPAPDKKETGFQVTPSETRTLTNDNGVGSSPSILPPATESERMARAMAALNKG